MSQLIKRKVCSFGEKVKCNPDIRELSGPEKSLISEFILYQFCLGNTGSNFGKKKSLLYSDVSLISGLLYTGYTVILLHRVILNFDKNMDSTMSF